MWTRQGSSGWTHSWLYRTQDSLSIVSIEFTLVTVVAWLLIFKIIRATRVMHCLVMFGGFCCCRDFTSYSTGNSIQINRSILNDEAHLQKSWRFPMSSGNFPWISSYVPIISHDFPARSPWVAGHATRAAAAHRPHRAHRAHGAGSAGAADAATPCGGAWHPDISRCAWGICGSGHVLTPLCEQGFCSPSKNVFSLFLWCVWSVTSDVDSTYFPPNYSHLI